MDTTAADPGDWVVLDRTGTITLASREAPPAVRGAVGERVYEMWPDLEDQLEPLCAEALTAGHSCGVIEHPAGTICEIYVRRCEEAGLWIGWRSLTLPGLEETLTRIASRRRRQAVVADSRSARAVPRTDQSARHLRAVS